MIHVKYIITLWPSILAHLIWWISKFGCMRVFNLPFQVEKPSLRRSLGRCEIYKSELSLPIFLHTCLHCIYNWHMYAYAHAVYASFYRKHCIWIGLSCWHFHFTQKLDMLISVYDAIPKDICSLHSSGKQSNNKSCFQM